jgi:DNA-binding IclR family transcriptional regulator
LAKNAIVETEDDSKYRAPALDKGLDIIELLAATEEGLTLGEIARALGRTSTELYRMLDRLARRGYVVRHNDSYELTLRLFVLAHQRPPMRRLIAHATPLMRRFARDAGQSCHLAMYDRGDLVVIAQIDSPGYWGLSIRVGAHLGLANTGSGHVILAYATPAERALMFEEHDWMPSEAMPADLDQRLEKARAQGCVAMASLQTPEVWNLSVPVFGANNVVLAALSCPYIRQINSPAGPDRDTALAMLVETGRDLSSEASDRD